MQSKQPPLIQHFWRAAITLLGVACSVSSVGCVILPTIPVRVPGYGRTYKIVDETGRPVGSGLLVLQSHYEMAAPMVRVFDIREGQALVPGRTDIRYGHGLWGAAYLPIPGYFGMLHNPKFTSLFVLADGYVPADTQPIHGSPGHSFTTPLINQKNPGPDVIRLRRADGVLEREWLEYCAKSIRDDNRSTRGDMAARQRVLDYIAKRLDELPSTRPAQRRPTM